MRPRDRDHTRTASATEHARATAMRGALAAGGADVTTIATGARPTDGVDAALDAARAGATAIMCASDSRQLAVMRAARRAGLDVPGDVSVSGCDGVLPGADLLGLTSLRIPVEGVADAAVATMRALLSPNSGRGTVREAFTGTLMPGSTVAVPRGLQRGPR